MGVGRPPLLLQLRELRLGFLQDGDVGIGVFPEREEILIGGTALVSVAGNGVSLGEIETSKCAEREI